MTLKDVFACIKIVTVGINQKLMSNLRFLILFLVQSEPVSGEKATNNVAEIQVKI